MATTTFIAIGGGTASGKTTLAKRLQERAAPGEVTVVTVDSYYRPQNLLTLEERSKLNYDHPDAIDFPLIHQHLADLRRGESIEVPVYDFATHNRAVESRPVQPTPLIVIEGILALHDATIRDHCALRVFVDSPAELRFQRRLERDVRDRGRTPESVHAQWLATVEPMHQQFCEPSRAFADIVCIGIGDDNAVISQVFSYIRPM